MEWNKRLIKINEPDNYKRYQALSKDSKEGKYWRNPCGTYDEPVPTSIECNLECEFNPAVRADGLLYEFFGN